MCLFLKIFQYYKYIIARNLIIVINMILMGNFYILGSPLRQALDTVIHTGGRQSSAFIGDLPSKGFSSRSGRLT